MAHGEFAHERKSLTPHQKKQKLDVIEEDVEKESLNETLERDGEKLRHSEPKPSLSAKKGSLIGKRHKSSVISYRPQNSCYSSFSVRKTNVPLSIKLAEEEG